MSSAFADPPDSGVNVSASADGAETSRASSAATSAASIRRRGMPVGKAGEIISAVHAYAPLRGGCPEPGPLNPSSRALECRRALLEERQGALLEVPRAREAVLQL